MLASVLVRMLNFCLYFFLILPNCSKVGANRSDNLIFSNCSQEILQQVYVTIAVLSVLDFRVPPIGTLLYQFSDLVSIVMKLLISVSDSVDG